MQKASQWMRKAGVGDYGYQGPRHLSAAHQAEDWHVAGPSRPVTRADVTKVVRQLPWLLVLFVRVAIVGLLASLFKGEKALNRYHAQHRWLAPTIVAGAVLFGVAVIVLAIAWP